MFNRIITIVFVLLTNILLLANITIPHHHHESEICVVSSHCDNDGQAHECTPDDHEHDAGNNDNCALSQVYIAPTDNYKQDYSQRLFSYNNHQLPDYMAIVTVDEVLKNEYIVSTVNRDVNLFSYYCFVSTSKGLRAPPLV